MRTTQLVVSLVLVCTNLLPAQETIDQNLISRLKEEGFQRSQLMETLSYLTDVHGPRLLGTPAYREAAEWAQARLTDWGLANARLEVFNDSLRGWEAESFSVEMTSPRYSPLLAWPKAWISGTNGAVEGTPILIEDFEPDSLQKYHGTLKGKIVLLGPGEFSEPLFKPFATRFSANDLKNAEALLTPVVEEGLSEMATQPISTRLRDEDKSMAEIRKWYQFFIDEQVGAMLEPSDFGHGIVHVDGTYFCGVGDIKPVPYFVVANEHYSRLVRMLDLGVSPVLRLDLQVKFHNEPQNNVNVLAELPGSEAKLKNQVVLLGAHFDSWHAGTGASDNAAGCVAMMEALRILKAIGARPARTIRLALWGGEEQGYYGSRGYIAAHVGDIFTGEKKAEQSKITAYFNLDNGTGKIRGIYTQGNETVRPIFQQLLAPFAYLGATTLTVQNTSWTDHEPFDALEIPAFQFIQDPINYMTVTHHTNMDLYEYAIEDDLKQNAVILAALAYHVANRPEMLPRKMGAAR